MYTCTSCGEKHEDMPALCFATPDPYNQLMKKNALLIKRNVILISVSSAIPTKPTVLSARCCLFRLSGMRKRWNTACGYPSVKRVLTTIKATFTTIRKTSFISAGYATGCPLTNPTPSACTAMSLPSPTTDVPCCNCIKAANIRWYTTFITA